MMVLMEVRRIDSNSGGVSRLIYSSAAHISLRQGVQGCRYP